MIFEARAFLAGKSPLVHELSFERACIGSVVDTLFQRESFNPRRTQQTMLSFLLTLQKSRKQTGNNNFRN